MNKYTQTLMILAGIFCLNLQAQTDALPAKEVSIFKNGTAFIVRKGQVPLTDGAYRIDDKDIPQALFGTFWFYTDAEEGLRVTKEIDTVEKKLDIQSIPTLLAENEKLRVRVKVEDEWKEGTLIQANNKIVLIQMTDRWLSLSPQSIKQIEFLGEPTYQRNSKEARANLKLAIDGPSKANIEMMYLSGGLGWLPNYLIELGEEDSAQLIFRAEVINNAVDLEDAELNFVVGVPNFSMANRTTPLVSSVDVVSFLANLNPGGFTNSIALQNRSVVQSFDYGSGFDDFGDDFAEASVSVESNVSGSSEEDLFFHSLSGIDLAKGANAYFNIFSTKVAVNHIYEAYIPANTVSRNYYRNQGVNNKFYDVEHKLKVKNGTDQPFTTGPAFVTRREEGQTRPISQDELKYTPSGGDSYLKITQAADVLVSHKEEEGSIEENAKRERRVVYDRVTIEGEITVRNYKDEDIDLNVRRAITGNLVKSSKDWLKSARVDFNRGLNPTTDVCWELNLKANEELTIKYSYQIYVGK